MSAGCHLQGEVPVEEVSAVEECHLIPQSPPQPPNAHPWVRGGIIESFGVESRPVTCGPAGVNAHRVSM